MKNNFKTQSSPYRTVQSTAIVLRRVIVLPFSIVGIVVGAEEGAAAVLIDEELTGDKL